VALYLDASVIVATLVSEATSEVTRQFLFQATEPMLVSSYTDAEVASALSRLVRMKKLTLDAARLTLTYFDDWRSAETMMIEVDDFDIVNAGDLVRQFELKLRTPDALHLAICLRIGAQLVTHDGGLAEAAIARGAVVIRPA
jgi:uncharacterized protein